MKTIHVCSASSRLNAPVIAGLLCLLVQVFAATWIVHHFDTPNASVPIARNLVEHGTYACDAWGRLHGIHHGSEDGGCRMFQLPGEPLYLAAAFKRLPERLLPYVHVPVTVLLILAMTCVATLLGGRAGGGATGIFASVQPFIVIHGPVWDDTFLGAALEWTIFAILFGRMMARKKETAWKRALWLTLLFALAGYAAITRSQSQVVLVAIAVLALVLPALRPLRTEALAILAGVVLALAAWGFRNDRVVGYFALGSSHDGITLWESVYPGAREALLTRGQTERLNDERMAADFLRTAEMGEVESNRYFTRRAIDYIRDHPLDVARTAFVKIAVGALGLDLPASLLTPRNLLALASNLVLFTLAAYGAVAWRARRSWPGRTLWRSIAIVLALSYLGLSALGPVGLRYRISLEPVLWIGAGAALVHMMNRTTRLLHRGPVEAESYGSALNT